MIITNSRQTPFQSAQFVEKQFSIRINPKLFEALGSLYTDPILAICREYMTNADEAHQLAGHKQPIRVTLPTVLKPEFVIEDKGPGLSQDKIFELFTTYGASGDEKETSNAYEGGFGLGGKCWRSYADSIIVESKHGGTKTTYSFFLDETGMGKAAVLDKTAAPGTGVTIRIPIKKDDIGTFTARAVKIGSMFPVRPTFTNLTDAQFKESMDDDMDFAKRTTIHKTDKFSYFGDGSASYVRMGRLIYPVTSQHLPSNFSAILKSLLEAGVLINFTVGELDLAPSRETLKYTTKTVSALFGELKAAADGMATGILKEVNDLPSEYQAILKINELTRKTYRGGNHYSSDVEKFSRQLAEKLDKKWTWQGKPLLHSTYELNKALPPEPAGYPNTTVEYYKSIGLCSRVFWLKNWGTKNLQFTDEREIIPSKRAAFVTTGTRMSSPNARIKKYLNDHKEFDHVYVLGLSDSAKAMVMAKYPGLMSLPFIEADTLPLPERDSSGDGNVASGVKSKKHCKGNVFVYDGSKMNAEKRSDLWDITKDYDLDVQEIYVVLDNFHATTLKGGHFGMCLNTARKALASVGMKFEHIHGIKTNDLDKVKDSKWLHITEAYDLACAKLDADEALKAKVYPIMAYSMASKGAHWSNRPKNLTQKEQGNLAYLKEMLKRMYSFIENSKGLDEVLLDINREFKALNDERATYSEWLSMAYTLEFDWSKVVGYEPAMFSKIRSVLTDYPLLRYFNYSTDSLNDTFRAKRVAALNEYITLKQTLVQKDQAQLPNKEREVA
jgi:hypothetical protein